MNIKQNIGHRLKLAVGTAILSFGLFNIHSQCNITEGGVLGMILLLEHWFEVSPSITGVILDFSCYFIGWKMLGNNFLKNAIFSTCCFSLWYRLWEHTGYMITDMSAIPLAAAVVGAVFVGIGVGIVVKEGGASGGDDALALVISKMAKCRISRAYLLTDLTVLTLSLSYIPFSKIIYSFITVTLSSRIIDKIQDM
ncbi:MAG: YitT family protein [Oscillospiraceae bacterium]|nr:YitT family protein [Oscillospiraceae bacterium]MBQ6850065.1 YitT family protein [Oscillospiraceae bacterium]MBR6609113.1 YitT family protein [Oscillospiraceae bacterium]